MTTNNVILVNKYIVLIQKSSQAVQWPSAVIGVVVFCLKFHLPYNPSSCGVNLKGYSLESESVSIYLITSFLTQCPHKIIKRHHHIILNLSLFFALFFFYTTNNILYFIFTPIKMISLYFWLIDIWCLIVLFYDKTITMTK